MKTQEFAKVFLPLLSAEEICTLTMKPVREGFLCAAQLDRTVYHAKEKRLRSTGNIELKVKTLGELKMLHYNNSYPQVGFRRFVEREVIN